MIRESAEVRSDTCQWHVDNMRTVCGRPMPCSRHQHDKQGHPFGFTVHGTEESFMAEVRSDQPAPSVDPDDPTLYEDMEGMTTQCSYIVHWYSCRLDAGHEGLHSPGRLPAPATPSLREALERLDGVFQWIREEYPKALVAMPREHYEAFANARAALASSDPGSPEYHGNCDADDACNDDNGEADPGSPSDGGLDE